VCNANKILVTAHSRFKLAVRFAMSVYYRKLKSEINLSVPLNQLKSPGLRGANSSTQVPERLDLRNDLHIEYPS
jgi:hypothetical protein